MTATPATVTYRFAERSDAPRIAELHADSWRRHYRGAFSDHYLDGPVVDDRLRVWAERFEQPDAGDRTVLAEVDAALVGFVHVIFDDDDAWGALVDNLHVRAEHQRSGVGRALMRRAAAIVSSERPGCSMYLWVLEQNDRAQAFYRSIGGVEADRRESEEPGGGVITGIRIVWPDPAALFGIR